MDKQQIEAILEAHSDEKILMADGFDEAILGIDDDSPRLIYSCKKAVSILVNQMVVKKSDLTKEEKEEGITIQDKKFEMATEHFEFNVKGSKGEGFPIWCEDRF